MRSNKLVTHFENAVEDHSWKGGGDPDEIPAIEKDYKDAKKALLEAVNGAIDAMKETLAWMEHANAVCEPEDVAVRDQLRLALKLLEGKKP